MNKIEKVPQTRVWVENTKEAADVFDYVFKNYTTIDTLLDNTDLKGMKFPLNIEDAKSSLVTMINPIYEYESDEGFMINLVTTSPLEIYEKSDSNMLDLHSFKPLETNGYLSYITDIYIFGNVIVSKWRRQYSRINYMFIQKVAKIYVCTTDFYEFHDPSEDVEEDDWDLK